MEFLQSSTARQQLLAVGDEVGTLHIFEIPRNLIKPVHKEDAIMLKFLDREVQVYFLTTHSIFYMVATNTIAHKGVLINQLMLSIIFKLCYIY